MSVEAFFGFILSLRKANRDSDPREVHEWLKEIIQYLRSVLIIVQARYRLRVSSVKSALIKRKPIPNCRITMLPPLEYQETDSDWYMERQKKPNASSSKK